MVLNDVIGDVKVLPGLLRDLLTVICGSTCDIVWLFYGDVLLLPLVLCDVLTLML
jgi:hypothetical protein